MNEEAHAIRVLHCLACQASPLSASILTQTKNKVEVRFQKARLLEGIMLTVKNCYGFNLTNSTVRQLSHWKKMSSVLHDS